MSFARIALPPVILSLASLPFVLPPLPAQQPAISAPNRNTTSSPGTKNFDEQITTIHATSRIVILDVVVTDGNGNPVKGLKPSDFLLTEDGVPQQLAGVEEHDPSAAPPILPEQPLPPNTFAVHAPIPEAVPKTVLVLDQLHYPNYPYVRAEIQAFFKTVAPGNPISIIRIDWQGLHLLQDFTADPEVLRDVVAGKKMLPPLPSINCLVRYRGVVNPYGRLARYIAGIPGRINLAWVTDEGAPDDAKRLDYPDLATFVNRLGGPANVLRLSRVSFNVIKAGGYIGGMLQPLPNADIEQTKVFKESLSELPTDCPLMPAAEGGLLANQALADLATSMGGHAFFDGTAKAMGQILAVGSDYYTLSYVPSNPNWNGAYRKINITVGTSRTTKPAFGWSAYGQQNALYRHGYFARAEPSPRQETAPPPSGSQPSSQRTLLSVSPKGVPASAAAKTTPLEAAMGFGVAAPDQIRFTIQVKPAPNVVKPKASIVPAKDNFVAASFHDTPYRDYHVRFWIDPERLHFTPTPTGTQRDDLQFAAIVYGDDGLAVNTISTTAHIQVSADDLETILISGVTFDQTIAIPAAGAFFLRTGVLETSTGHIGALELPTDQIQLPPATHTTTAAKP